MNQLLRFILAKISRIPANPRLGKDYGPPRLEAACSRAIDLKAPNYRFIASTLKNGLETKADTAAAQAALPLMHANVRGPDYYH
ncbi:hypothetical protein [Burkholderia anthina]|uniref:hypothetical protein n=1 Tax=Burkholderia anthina TaxID=179879 RepID=UPI001FB82158|nr:hypothetical protein [Burkholderia anthina]